MVRVAEHRSSVPSVVSVDPRPSLASVHICGLHTSSRPSSLVLCASTAVMLPSSYRLPSLTMAVMVKTTTILITTQLVTYILPPYLFAKAVCRERRSSVSCSYRYRSVSFARLLFRACLPVSERESLEARKQSRNDRRALPRSPLNLPVYYF